MTHGFHEIARHAGKGQDVSGPPRLLHLHERANDLADVAA
jgi:hypothetical protein